LWIIATVKILLNTLLKVLQNFRKERVKVLHFFKTRIDIQVSREEVFSFFSDAVNLEKITPVELGFKIISPLPTLMAPGTLIDYRLIS
jgi:hypothetical protein